MDFNFKAYQKVKLKKYLKNNSLFFLFHSVKLDLSKWMLIEQNLEKLNLDYYKPLNKLTMTIFKNSIFENYSANIAGFLVFINSKQGSKELKLNLPHLTKALRQSFTLASVKLNNKIYATSQLKGVTDLSYKKSAFNFYKVLDKQLKTSYILTNKKHISK